MNFSTGYEVLQQLWGLFWGGGVDEGTLDGESVSFGGSASKKQEVLSFLRRGLWQRMRLLRTETV